MSWVSHMFDAEEKGTPWNHGRIFSFVVPDRAIRCPEVLIMLMH